MKDLSTRARAHLDALRQIDAPESGAKARVWDAVMVRAGLGELGPEIPPDPPPPAAAAGAQSTLADSGIATHGATGRSAVCRPKPRARIWPASRPVHTGGSTVRTSGTTHPRGPIVHASTRAPASSPSARARWGSMPVATSSARKSRPRIPAAAVNPAPKRGSTPVPPRAATRRIACSDRRRLGAAVGVVTGVGVTGAAVAIGGSTGGGDGSTRSTTPAGSSSTAITSAVADASTSQRSATMRWRMIPPSASSSRSSTKRPASSRTRACTRSGRSPRCASALT